MKKILFLLFLVGFVSAQAQDSKRDKIKALKTAYITEHLELTPKEAEKFWPIYNEYSKTYHELRKSRKSVYCNLNDEDVTAEEGKALLNQYLALEERRCNLRKVMLTKLSSVLPIEKIIRLRKVEDDFHKKLLEEYSSRKAQNKN